MVDETNSASPAEDTETKVVDAVAAASAASDANTAPESSTEATDAKPAADDRKLTDVIRDVLQPKEESSTSEDEKKSEQSEPAKDDVKAETDDKSEADKTKAKVDEDVPAEFHKHPAWQRQIQRTKDAQAEAARFKPDAEQFQALTKFTTEKGISNTEVAEAVMLLALIRDNPEKARDSLAKSVAALDGVLGNTLTKDLQDKVESGEMTEEAARELSRTRAKANRSETLRTTSETTRQAAETKRLADEEAAKSERETAEFRENVRAKVAAYETLMSKTDPDYARKYPLVVDRIRAVLAQRGGLYKSAEDALQLSKDAYDHVSKHMAPSPQARRAVTSIQGGGAASERLAAKSMSDAIRGALEG